MVAAQEIIMYQQEEQRRKETNHTFYAYDCEGKNETEGANIDLVNIENCDKELLRNYEKEVYIGVVLIVKKHTVNIEARRCHLQVIIESAYCASPKPHKPLSAEGFVTDSETEHKLTPEQCIKAHEEGVLRVQLGSQGLTMNRLKSPSVTMSSTFIHGSGLTELTKICKPTIGLVYLGPQKPYTLGSQLVVQAKLILTLDVENAVANIRENTVLVPRMGLRMKIHDDDDSVNGSSSGLGIAVVNITSLPKTNCSKYNVVLNMKEGAKLIAVKRIEQETVKNDTVPDIVLVNSTRKILAVQLIQVTSNVTRSVSEPNMKTS